MARIEGLSAVRIGGEIRGHRRAPGRQRSPRHTTAAVGAARPTAGSGPIRLRRARLSRRRDGRDRRPGRGVQARPLPALPRQVRALPRPARRGRSRDRRRRARGDEQRHRQQGARQGDRRGLLLLRRPRGRLLPPRLRVRPRERPAGARADPGGAGPLCRGRGRRDPPGHELHGRRGDAPRDRGRRHGPDRGAAVALRPGDAPVRGRAARRRPRLARDARTAAHRGPVDLCRDALRPRDSDATPRA